MANSYKYGQDEKPTLSISSQFGRLLSIWKGVTSKAMKIFWNEKYCQNRFEKKKIVLIIFKYLISTLAQKIERTSNESLQGVWWFAIIYFASLYWAENRSHLKRFIDQLDMVLEPSLQASLVLENQPIVPDCLYFMLVLNCTSVV